MRMVIISDTHSKHRALKMPEGDVLIHAGDFTSSGSLHDLKDFNEWLGELSYNKIIVISGNHDFCFERQPIEAKKILTNAIYLEDEIYLYDRITFYGSPWQPIFFNWAFNLDSDSLMEKWAMIPESTDVLITHGPPYSILDRTSRGRNVGCVHLLDKVKQVKPMLHAFGHIQEAYGEIVKHETTFINASTCDLSYRAINAPVVYDLSYRAINAPVVYDI